MIEWLDELDKILFILVNIEMANPVTDFIMPYFTSDTILRVTYALAVILLLWLGNARIRWLVLFSVVAMVLSDQISSNALKDLIQRPRPCQIMSDLNLLVECGPAFSMPSSHAVNSFAQAALFGTLIPVTRWYMIIGALLISISRVFVGVHYPGDVLVGSLLGIVIGLFVAGLFLIFEYKVIKRVVRNRNSQG
jgi:undecaprenyl-diphosphatase